MSIMVYMQACLSAGTVVFNRLWVAGHTRRPNNLGSSWPVQPFRASKNRADSRATILSVLFRTGRYIHSVRQQSILFVAQHQSHET